MYYFQMQAVNLTGVRLLQSITKQGSSVRGRRSTSFKSVHVLIRNTLIGRESRVKDELITVRLLPG